MTNSGVAVQNALYETSGPGIFAGVGGELFGENGQSIGQAADLFTGVRARPAAIASGSINSVKELYDIATGANIMRNGFGKPGDGCD